MKRDYRLYELHHQEFEALVVRICSKWFGDGVIPFAPGKDGGRDGKFVGKAQTYPSITQPLEGTCIFQAKHESTGGRSCSDRDFRKTMKAEYPKITRLVKDGLCEHYLIFSNRKCTAGTEEEIVGDLMKLGLKSAGVVGVEKLHLALDGFQDIQDTLPNLNDPVPFRFDANDLIQVINAIHSYTADRHAGVSQAAIDFEKLKLKEKNKLNGVSDAYYQEMIVAGSMPHFETVDGFLKNPRNVSFADLYYDSADELKQKIFLKRAAFSSFEEIFPYLYDQVQRRGDALSGRRRLISIILHYMYCNCDIGSKVASPLAGGDHVDA